MEFEVRNWLKSEVHEQNRNTIFFSDTREFPKLPRDIISIGNFIVYNSSWTFTFVLCLHQKVSSGEMKEYHEDDHDRTMSEREKTEITQEVDAADVFHLFNTHHSTENTNKSPRLGLDDSNSKNNRNFRL